MCAYANNPLDHVFTDCPGDSSDSLALSIRYSRDLAISGASGSCSSNTESECLKGSIARWAPYRSMAAHRPSGSTRNIGRLGLCNTPPCVCTVRTTSQYHIHCSCTSAVQLNTCAHTGACTCTCTCVCCICIPVEVGHVRQ